MCERMFRDESDLQAHLEDDLREGNFEVQQRTSEQQRTAKNELIAMRHNIGMLIACYQAIQMTLDQAFQCLAHGSITPAEGDAVRSTMLIFHAQLRSAGVYQADEILGQIQAERRYLITLSDARKER